MHLNSRIHRGSEVPCPFCKETYSTASAVAHYLESGSCSRAPMLNRETILYMTRERDRNGIITNKQIGWHRGENIEYSATQHAFNGYHWECYLCHREYGSITALNSHLNSPAHKQKVYHCPNSKAKCGKEFVSLAALFNHLENGTCAFIRFEHMQQRVRDVLQGGRMIAF